MRHFGAKSALCGLLGLIYLQCVAAPSSPIRQSINNKLQVVKYLVLQKAIGEAIMKASDAAFLINTNRNMALASDVRALISHVIHLQQDSRFNQVLNELMERHLSETTVWFLRQLFSWMSFQISNVEFTRPLGVSFNIRASTKFEKFVRAVFEASTLDPNKDPGFLLHALFQAKGVCSIFTHPFSSFFVVNELADESGHRLAYIAASIFIELDDRCAISALAYLEIACNFFKLRPTIIGEQKMLLYHLLKPTQRTANSLDVPPYLSTIYFSTASANSICGRMKAIKQDNFRSRFPKDTTQFLFVKACFEDLILLARNLLYSNDEYNAYNECIYKRWLTNIKVFLDGQLPKLKSQAQLQGKAVNELEIHKSLLDPNINKNYENFLHAVTNQLPSLKAIKAFETGSGFCDKIIGQEGKWIQSSFYMVYELMPSLKVRIGSLPYLSEFIYLSITCENLAKQKRTLVEMN